MNEGRLKELQAVIFDWDNTLVDSWDAIAQSINYVRGEFGLPIWNLEEIKKNCTRAARESFPEWFGHNWQKAYDVYYRRFDEVRQTARLTALPGSADLLALLKSHSIPICVVSNKRGEYLRQETIMIGWQDIFFSVVGAQDAKKDKPARDPVDLALSKLNIVANKGVWFVGDSEVDMLCAKNSDCTPVYIGHKETASRLSAAHSFSNCIEMRDWLYNYSS